MKKPIFAHNSWVRASRELLSSFLDLQYYGSFDLISYFWTGIAPKLRTFCWHFHLHFSEDVIFSHSCQLAVRSRIIFFLRDQKISYEPSRMFFRKKKVHLNVENFCRSSRKTNFWVWSFVNKWITRKEVMWWWKNITTVVSSSTALVVYMSIWYVDSLRIWKPVYKLVLVVCMSIWIE